MTDSPRWQFHIDVGGTFTDVVARRPDGALLTHKLLSSGIVRGKGIVRDDGRGVVASDRRNEPDGFWIGYRLSIAPRVEWTGAARADRSGQSNVRRTANVVEFDATRGFLGIDSPWADAVTGTIEYELRSDEEAPVVAIRRMMGLRRSEPIGVIDVRLGTTRATNALLERKGARTAFVTTKGFGDVLRIGYQDRPELFRLDIRKRDELAETVIEIDERIAADGAVLKPPDEVAIRKQLEEARRDGIEALAICLLHSHVNPLHEEVVARVAESFGFPQVSVSSRIARLEKIVPRGDTAVVDAYLGGVIRGYVASLRRSMPEARIRLMTSNGGLVDGSSAGGKDTILSGPAGGVIGCRHVGRSAGFSRTIGFDMGGTSTDVCRIEPPPREFEYQHETVKAGVRIMAPMLGVETVAAGGGSICFFDGRMLRVGPHSAGSDPGPACYGRGGPLTITDMNLLLGRVVADHFPFALDVGAVERLIGRLCDEINSATGSSLTTVRLAEGFVRIANERMAAAIRRISTARGYDPRDYALVSFGGAGGQHACAVARSLGITRILCSPFAGVLSALGVGRATMQRIREQSILLPLREESLFQAREVAEAMIADATASLVADGVDPQSIAHPRVSADLRYTGQATLLSVATDSIEAMKKDFERQHRQLYGYCHDGRGIEMCVIRVEVRSNEFAVAESRTAGAWGIGDGPPVRSWEHDMIVDGARRSTTLHVRRGLAAGATIEGPAIVIEDTSTLVVEPGWRGEMAEDGAIVLIDERGEGRRKDSSSRVDPIELELFNNRFAAIAEQMGETLRRTAISTNVKERLDFSCAIFTPSGDLVVNAPHIPVHLGGMSDCVKCLIEEAGGFHPGDVLITNDPFRGGSHLNDVTVVSPVHDEAGKRILFFVASRAHHAEIGGRRPGSMPPDSTCLADEGVLIRCFRWIHDGREQSVALRELLAAPPFPSRNPDENLADIAAQVAANRTGANRLLELASRFGVDTVHAYMRYIQDAAEAKMRDAIRRLPEGARTFEDRLDDGAPIRVRLTIAGDSVTVDFSGTAGVLCGNLNANRSIVTSAVLYCFRCLIDEEIPLNAGVLSPIEMILPECFLNPPAHDDPRRCPAVAGGNVETSQRIVDTIFGALGVVAAGQGTMNNLLIGNDRFGYYETICGGAGAGPGFHGADAVHTHMTNTRMTDPEVLESRYPVRLRRFVIRRGSGGSGRFRGGCGATREFEFLEPLEVSIISQRRAVAPYGMSGGECGLPGRNALIRAGADAAESLPPIVSLTVQAGDRLLIETPGGGGWGRE